MGGAILQKFLKNGIAREDILAIDSDPKNDFADFNSMKKIVADYQADIVVFAIKPQDSEVTLKEFFELNLFHRNTIFISILAGKNIKFFEKILGKNKKIIRLMPNLPILIDEGICAYFANKNLNQFEELESVNLFGKNLKFFDESAIDKVTAISGSGPAYLFLFAKNLIESGEKIGLNSSDAKKLVKQTIYGAAKMLLKENDLDLLINNVTSKGGTTAAALDVFNNPKKSLKSLTLKAVKAAFKRSKTLK